MIDQKHQNWGPGELSGTTSALIKNDPFVFVTSIVEGNPATGGRDTGINLFARLSQGRSRPSNVS